MRQRLRVIALKPCKTYTTQERPTKKQSSPCHHALKGLGQREIDENADA
jgi:hypothetical protein